MWQPPDNPDPHKILNEAVDDSGNGRPEIALQKFLWFHEHATRFKRSLSAVRLSFALGYWMELAAHYEPAFQAFVRTRDETQVRYLADPESFELFHDIASLNRYLNEREKTAKLFEWIASQDHETAKRLYHVAEPHLISVGAYRLCGRFLEPDKRISLAAKSYRLLRQNESRWARQNPAPPPMARHFYTEDLSTLVALLVLNDQIDEARDACEKSLLVIDDEDFRLDLDAAMTGHLPRDR